MECSYCKNDFPEKELGKFKDKLVCFQCATNQGIPADFDSFLEDMPKDGGDPTVPGGGVKAKGSWLVTFLLSAIFAVATIYFTMRFGHLDMPYIYLIEGVLAGTLVRLMQKGRGGTHQNITAVMIMVSFLIPQLLAMQGATEFDPFELMKKFIWLVAGVFASYMLLIEITPAKKKK